jgi:P pilus assembly chaperone PapD
MKTMVKTIKVSLSKVMTETQNRSLSPHPFEWVGGQNATGTVAVLNGTVNYITVTNGGNGFTSIPTVTISGGGGSLATGTAMISNGSVTAVILGNLGTNYTSEPSISFSGGRSEFPAYMIEKGD